MQLTISINGTPEEISEFCKKRGIDLNLIADNLPIALRPNGKEKGDDTQKINRALQKMSWETIYLAHLIVVNAGSGQKDELGSYLTRDQIEKFNISERQVASRFGGAKRICKRVDLNYILFSKKRPDGSGKNYYVSRKFISDLEGYMKQWEFEYREFLDDSGLEYPGQV